MSRTHLFALAPPEPSTREVVAEYNNRVDHFCEQWVGRGEAPGQNNRGSDIRELHDIAGCGRRDKHGEPIYGSWCGIGSSAMCVLATGTRDKRFVPFEVSRGAIRFVKNVGKAGSFIVKPRTWMPGTVFKGDLDPALMEHALAIAWMRFGSWVGAGHVALRPKYNPVTDEMTVWNPNVPPPVSVRNELNDRLNLALIPGQAVCHYRTLPGSKWRKSLSCIATLVP